MDFDFGPGLKNTSFNSATSVQNVMHIYSGLMTDEDLVEEVAVVSVEDFFFTAPLSLLVKTAVLIDELDCWLLFFSATLEPKKYRSKISNR